MKSKSGRELNVRQWELYTGNCPPERPCPPEQVLNQYRELYDRPLDESESTYQEKHPPHQAASEENLFRRFLLAIKEELAWRTSGGRSPTNEEKTERRRICEACEYHNKEKDKCNICGCYLEAGLLPLRPVGKLDCSTQRCPLGRWETVGGYKAKGCGGK